MRQNITGVASVLQLGNKAKLTGVNNSTLSVVDTNGNTGNIDINRLTSNTIISTTLRDDMQNSVFRTNVLINDSLKFATSQTDLVSYTSTIDENNFDIVISDTSVLTTAQFITITTGFGGTAINTVDSFIDLSSRVIDASINEYLAKKQIPFETTFDLGTSTLSFSKEGEDNVYIYTFKIYNKVYGAVLSANSSGVFSINANLANGSTATTQALNDNSTKVATTEYADRAAENASIPINTYNF